MRAADFVVRVIGFSLLAAGLGYGQLGTTLEEEKKTDLFTFFHLEETERDAAVHFRSTGDFHDFAELQLVLTDGHISAARLSLARPFLQGINGVFAKDFMVSYLRNMLTARDAATVGPLLRQADIPTLGGVEGSFACKTPAAFDALKDARLAVRCDEAKKLLTLDVIEGAAGTSVRPD
jgi:hypothetical protein